MDKPNITLDQLLQIIGDKEVTIIALKFEIRKLQAMLAAHEDNGSPDPSPAL